MFNPADAFNSPAFKSCIDAAQDYLVDKEKAGELINRANAKLDKMENSGGPVGDAVRSARTGVRMIQAYVMKGYTKVPIKSLAAITGAILYFLQENDLIPDNTPFIGYADDAAMIMFALKMVQSDLDDFVVWEKEQAGSPA